MKGVSRITAAMRNGSKVENLKSFKKDPINYRQGFSYMGGTGTFEVSKKHTFSVDVVIDKNTPKIDWSEVENENWSFELNGGSRVEYTGVDCLTEGEMIVDFEKETVMTLTFQAEGRSIR
jgi:hypothetical protein